MEILVLRHEPFEHLGHFSRLLDAKNIPFTYKDLGESLSLDGYTGVIVMGGPQSANDPDPGLAGELQLIEKAIESQVPVLGVCLGAQLIAKALGARVYKNAAKEIGWAPVYFTDAAKDDPIFGSCASPTTFFHWHGETVRSSRARSGSRIPICAGTRHFVTGEMFMGFSSIPKSKPR